LLSAIAGYPGSDPSKEKNNYGISSSRGAFFKLFLLRYAAGCGFSEHSYITNRAGVILICANIDYRVLRPTEETNYQAAYAFYSAFHNAPPAVKVGVLDAGKVMIPQWVRCRQCYIP
jgi:hypothetical protein